MKIQILISSSVTPITSAFVIVFLTKTYILFGTIELQYSGLALQRLLYLSFALSLFSPLTFFPSEKRGLRINESMRSCIMFN